MEAKVSTITINVLSHYTCVKCKEVKENDEFHRSNIIKMHYICKQCASKKTKDGIKNDPSKRVLNRLKSRKNPMFLDAVRKLLKEYADISTENKHNIDADEVDIVKVVETEPLSKPGNAKVVLRVRRVVGQKSRRVGGGN